MCQYQTFQKPNAAKSIKSTHKIYKTGPSLHQGDCMRQPAHVLSQVPMEARRRPLPVKHLGWAAGGWRSWMATEVFLFLDVGVGNWTK